MSRKKGINLAKRIIKFFGEKPIEVTVSYPKNLEYGEATRPAIVVRAYERDGAVYLATSTPTRAPQGIEPHIRTISLDSATFDAEDARWTVTDGDQVHNIEEAAWGVGPLAGAFEKFKASDIKAAAKKGFSRFFASLNATEIVA